MKEKYHNTIYIILVALVIVIVLFIGIRTSTTTSEDTAGQATRVTEIAIPSKNVNANSCKADSVCEANTVNSPYITTSNLKSNGNLNLVADNGNIIITPDNGMVTIDGGQSSASLWVNSNTVSSLQLGNSQTVVGNIALFGSQSTVLSFIQPNNEDHWDILTQGTDPYLYIWDNFAGGPKLSVGHTEMKVQNSDFKIESLSGTGNAFLCVDSTGKFYRSETPCTGTTSGGLTAQDVLNVLNSCKYYSGTLAQGQDCNAVCTNPSVWGQSEPPGTCITGEFAYDETTLGNDFKGGGTVSSPFQWNDNDEQTLEFIAADANGDTVVTGEELCNHYSMTCLYTQELTYNVMTNQGNIAKVAGPTIGCYGGQNFDFYRNNLMRGFQAKCINYEDNPYSGTLVRCEFKETGRDITCVCCTP